VGLAAGAAGDVHRRADAAHQPRRPVRMSRTGPCGDPSDRARRRRWLRLQGHPAARGDLLRMAGDAPATADPLARGSSRAARRQRKLPRTRLRHHALRGTRRTAAGDRLRSERRCRRLLLVPVLGLPGGRSGQFDPAGAVPNGGLSVPHLLGGHQQAADPPLPRRCAHRRVLRPRTRAGRGGSRGGHRTLAGSGCQPGVARGDAVREHHTQAFRLGRLPAVPRAGAEGAGPAEVARPAGADQRDRLGRADRRGPVHVLRAGRPRHLGLPRLGHPDGTGP
jgi:hypothetical protein